MTFVCKLISSEQMIFLCLFKKQAVSMTDAFIIQTIDWPSGHLSPPKACPSQQALLTTQHFQSPWGTWAKVQILQTAPHSWTCNSQPLLSKSGWDKPLKKNLRKHPIFYISCTETWTPHFYRFIKYLRSQELEEIYINIQKKLPSRSFISTKHGRF